MNNKIKKKSPARWWQVPLAIVAGITAYKGIKKAARADKRLRGELSDAQEQFDKRLADYEKSQFQPIDPSIVDQENIYEDLYCNFCLNLLAFV